MVLKGGYAFLQGEYMDRDQEGMKFIFRIQSWKWQENLFHVSIKSPDIFRNH